MRTKEVKTRNKGITLIALVVTIIVLLILAGVSIATLTGDNGILTQANKAKENTEQAEEDELRRLTVLEAATNLENTIYTDKNNVTITIPAGFAVSQVEGENTIEDGLVIIDKNENEFVWVPVKVTEKDTVDNIYNFQRTITYNGTITEVGLEYSEPYITEEEKKEYKAMYESVYKNKGFFIGRYETGAKLERVDELDTNNQGEQNEIFVQKGLNVYNYVPWGNNMISTEPYEGIIGAVELSRNFAKKNNYISVESTLCYGVQWDAILQYIGNDEATVGVETKEKLNLTGVSNDIKHNIYDLSGNVREWTMEARYDYGRVGRGGTISYSNPPSKRNANEPNYRDKNIGFRIALYIK